MARLETITLYNKNGTVTVNKKDREEKLAEGYSEKPFGSVSADSAEKSYTKAELQEMAQEAGHDVEGLKKSELKELLGM